MASVRDGLQRMAALFKARAACTKRLTVIDRELNAIGAGRRRRAAPRRCRTVDQPLHSW